MSGTAGGPGPAGRAPLTVLAWDTAGPRCCLALVRFDGRGGRRADEFVGEPGEKHSQILPPQVALMLERAGLKTAGLDLLAVGRGPGSFTGLRTGLALAKGLAMGSDKPLMGISTLETLAALMLEEAGLEAEAPLRTEILAAPIIDARHREVYAALYRASWPLDGGPPVPECLLPPEPLAPEEVWGRLSEAAAGRKVVAGGPGLGVVRASGGEPPAGWVNAPEDLTPSAVMLARLAAVKFWASETELNPPLPMYIRPPDIRRSGLVV